MAVFVEMDNLDRQQLALKYSHLKGIFEVKDGVEYNSEIYNREVYNREVYNSEIYNREVYNREVYNR